MAPSVRTISGTVRLVALLALAFACVLALAATASAAYQRTGAFSGPGTGEGQLSSPSQADLNSATQTLYVADTVNNRVQAFRVDERGGELALSGRYHAQVAITEEPNGLAVDQASGAVYVSRPGGIDKFDAGLKPVPAAQWSNPGTSGSLAVDPDSGDLLVGDLNANQVLRYSADGQPDATTPTFAVERPLDLAATSSGTILVVTSTGDLSASDCSNSSALRRFSADGVDEGAVGSEAYPSAVAIDPDDGSIALAVHTAGYYECGGLAAPQVAILDPAGNLVESVDLQNSYATVPGLASSGAERARVFAVAKGPFNDGFGATEVSVLVSPSVKAVDTNAATGIGASEATFNGKVNPGGVELTECRFDYGNTVSYGQSIPCAETTPAIGDGVNDVSVHADVSGLGAGAHHFRLVATNADGITVGDDEVAPATPVIESQSVTYAFTEGKLNASINPSGAVTTYHFEYGPTPAYGQKTPEKSIPAGIDPVAVSADLFGLTAGSGYHYRVVAGNDYGTSEGADRTFTMQSHQPSENCPNAVVRAQQAAGYLPDCRAYEQVSPVDKNGTDARADALLVSDDGRGITWRSLGVYGNAPGGNAEALYAAHRTDSGWATTVFAASKTEYPDVEPGNAAALVGWVLPGDLSNMFVTTFGGFDSADKDSRGQDIYRIDSTGHATWISHGQGVDANDPDSPNSDGPTRQGAGIAAVSDDGSTVFFYTGEPMTPGIPEDRVVRLYRWRDGFVEAVGVDKTGALLSGVTRLGNGSTRGYNYEQTGQTQDSAAVSRDGSTFVYMGEDLLARDKRVFLHEDGTPSTEISLSQKTGSVGQQASKAELIAVTPELDKIYLYSPDQLSDDAPAGGGTYVYDRATKILSFSHPEEPEVYVEIPQGQEWIRLCLSGTVQVSADGAYVYFTSTKVLAPGAVADRSNLYVKHDGVTKLIGTLGVEQLGVAREGLKDVGYPSHTSSYLSDSGQKLVFMSSASLGGFESNNYRTVYLYDARTDEIACASCAPSGALPQANSSFEATGENEKPMPRAISADGRTVAFTSGADLVPRDTNGVADVYEYREGRLYLISSGVAAAPALFAGMSPDGADLYMFTRASLVPSDVDGGSVDVYDARVRGGFLVPTTKAPCQGDSCQGPLAAPPAALGVASAGVTGPGNVRHRHKTGSGKKKPRHAAKHKKKTHGKRRPSERTGSAKGEHR